MMTVFDKKAYMKEYSKTNKCKAIQKNYRRTSIEYKERQKKYKQSDKYKAWQKAYHKKYMEDDKHKERQKEYQTAYRQDETYKERQKKYRQTDRYKEQKRKYDATDKAKERRKKYYNSEKYKAYRKIYTKLPYVMELNNNRTKATRKKMRLEALYIVGNGKIECARCGCNDIRAIEINHIGCNAYSETGKSNIATNIVKGKRKIDDLNLLCRVCNAAYYIEKRYNIKYSVKWGE
jgi:hypothetical protein